jgi:hypothetical protein
VGTGRLTTKGLHGLRLFVRSGIVWQLINQILRGGCNGEGSSQWEEIEEIETRKEV